MYRQENNWLGRPTVLKRPARGFGIGLAKVAQAELILCTDDQNLGQRTKAKKDGRQFSNTGYCARSQKVDEAETKSFNQTGKSK